LGDAVGERSPTTALESVSSKLTCFALGDLSPAAFSEFGGERAASSFTGVTGLSELKAQIK